MNQRQSVVAATLSALDIPLKIDELGDRTALQKAVYLAQEAGVNLGYPYGWHKKSPYSPELAGDYREAVYTLSLAPAMPRLRKQYRAVLESLRPRLDPPHGETISKVEWLELLASLHFLRKYVGQTKAEAHSTIRSNRRAFSQYLGAAEIRLAEAGLA